MLKNLYNTFIAELEYIKKGNQNINIDKQLLFQYHSALVQDLINNEDRGFIRKKPLRITGTGYVPPKDKFEILR